MAKRMDFFLFFGSTYAYLSVMRIDALASAAGVEIVWRPFNVRRIMIDMENIPFANKPAKAAYMWRDIERRAARYGLEFRKQPPYPADPEFFANRVGLVAAEEGWCSDYARASYRAWFLDHKVIGTDNVTQDIVAALGKDLDAVMARANSSEIVDRFDAETEAARSLGIFGAPTFMVDGEMFWGDDRLDDAIEWCAKGGAG